MLRYMIFTFYNYGLIYVGQAPESLGDLLRNHMLKNRTMRYTRCPACTSGYKKEPASLLFLLHL